MNNIIGLKPQSSDNHVQTLHIDEASAGQRLDNFLIRQLKGVPKTHVYRIIRSGEVRVNKGRAAADTRVQLGDVIRVPPVRLSERAAEKAAQMTAQRSPTSSKNFPLLFEDEQLLVLNKPAGIAVHGGSGISFGVIEQLRIARPKAEFLELVHRLDRETSGILMVAKKRSALRNLQDQFRERSTGKTYLALVLGRWPANKRVLDRPLRKYLIETANGEGERRVKVVSPDDPEGMPSLTLIKVRASSGPLIAGEQPYSLLEVTIKTGRTHQIRVHLAAEGMPIAGDDKYGDFEHNKLLARASNTTSNAASNNEKFGELKRMFLHAWRLQCRHPGSSDPLQLKADLPPELVSFLHFALPQALPHNVATKGIIPTSQTFEENSFEHD